MKKMGGLRANGLCRRMYRESKNRIEGWGMTASERQRFIEALDSAGMRLNMVIDGVDDTPPSELLAMLRDAESKIQRARKVIDRR